MIKISVIVAVYQVERFIRKCLNSLQNQTFSDFEVLLIDDSQGLICPPDSDDAIAQALKKIILDDSYRQTIQKTLLSVLSTSNCPTS